MIHKNCVEDFSAFHIHCTPAHLFKSRFYNDRGEEVYEV